ncbi:2-phosphosulfolactate phosphatase [hydrocarbon metagenome]|uniref:2-phosphosulfolactate phosphatase n=1 Tax=hydrocarbon metagenome TaxID=938273 RepID=A0A0W8E953_9ZZZZ
MNTALSIRDYTPARDDNTVCIVIDVIRASSTIVTLLDNGCRRVYALADKEQARQLAAQRQMLTSGEWQGLKLADFDMGNSPAEIKRFSVRNRDVALCTSNGTRVIDRAKNCVELFIASLLNARVCARAALITAQTAGCGITVVCAGQYGSFVLDDAYCAGYLLQEMEIWAERLGVELKTSDSCRAAKALIIAYPDARVAFSESDSGKTLLAIGGQEDFEFCLQSNISEVVPYIQLDQELIWFTDWQNQK